MKGLIFFSGLMSDEVHNQELTYVCVCVCDLSLWGSLWSQRATHPGSAGVVGSFQNWSLPSHWLYWTEAPPDSPDKATQQFS